MKIFWGLLAYCFVIIIISMAAISIGKFVERHKNGNVPSREK